MLADYLERTLVSIPELLKLGFQRNSGAEVPKTDFGEVPAFCTLAKMVHYSCHGQGRPDYRESPRHLG
jgi:hypothetical protein